MSRNLVSAVLHRPLCCFTAVEKQEDEPVFCSIITPVWFLLNITEFKFCSGYFMDHKFIIVTASTAEILYAIHLSVIHLCYSKF